MHAVASASTARADRQGKTLHCAFPSADFAGRIAAEAGLGRWLAFAWRRGATFTCWPCSSESGGLITIWSLGGNSAQNFKSGSVISSNVDGAQLNFLVRPHHGHLRALGAEQHRIHGNRNFVDVRSDGKMHFAERSRQQPAIGDWARPLRSAGFEYWDRWTPQFARSWRTNFCPGNSCQRDIGLGAHFDIRRVSLGNAGVYAQRIDARDVEQFAACSACPGIDQRAGIDVSFA